METKKVITIVMVIVILVGVLWVRKQYNNINKEVPLKPSGAATTTVAKLPVSGPPQQTKSQRAAARKEIEAFDGLTFGSDESAILGKFGSLARKYERRQEFAGGTYSDYFIPEQELEGVKLKTIFQMDKRTQGLARVVLTKNAENQAPYSLESEFNTLLAAFTSRYGVPESTSRGGRNENNHSEEKSWVADGREIGLRHSQAIQGNLTSESLTVRYRLAD